MTTPESSQTPATDTMVKLAEKYKAFLENENPSATVEIPDRRQFSEAQNQAALDQLRKDGQKLGL